MRLFSTLIFCLSLTTSFVFADFKKEVDYLEKLDCINFFKENKKTISENEAIKDEKLKKKYYAYALSREADGELKCNKDYEKSLELNQKALQILENFKRPDEQDLEQLASQYNLAAYALERVGRFPDAIKLLKKGNDIHEKYFYEKSYEVIKVNYSLLSFWNLKIFNYDESYFYQKKYISYVIEISGKYSQEHFDSLITLGFDYMDGAQYQRALDIFLSLEKDIDKFSHLDNYKMANFYRYASLAFYRMQDYKKQNLYLKKGFDFFEKIIGSDSQRKLILETALNNDLALSYQYIFETEGNYENLELAEKYYLRLVELEKNNSDKTEYHTVLGNLSGLYRLKGNFDLSIDYAKKSIAECGKLYGNYAKPCLEHKNQIAHLFSETGENIKAKKILEEIIQNEPEDYGRYLAFKISARNLLASIHRELGNYDAAERHIYDAINFLDPENPKHQMTYYDTLNSLYLIFLGRGNYSEALKGYADLLKILEEKYGKNSNQLIPHLNNIAYGKGLIGKSDEAIPHLKRALKIIEQNQSGHALEGAINHNLGWNYKLLGSFAEAEKYYLAAISINEQKKLESKLFETKIELAQVKINLKNYKAAEKLLKDSEKLIAKYLPQNHPIKINIYNKYLDLYSNSKNLDEYNKTFIKTYTYVSDYSKGLLPKINVPINYFDESLKKMFDTVSYLSNEEFLETSNFFRLKTNNNIESGIIELSELVRSSKINRSVQNMIDRSKDSSVAKEKRKLQNLLVQYEKMPKDSNDPKEKKEIFKKLKLIKKDISNQKEVILAKLNLSTLSNYSKEIDIKELQNELSNHQVLISYLFTRLHLHIAVITSKNIIFERIDKNNEKINQLIEQIRKTLKVDGSGKIPEFDILSSKILYNLILHPISSSIKDKKELIIIPHKSLLSVPFEILIDQEGYESSDKDYRKINWLGKKYAISYYPSIYSFYNLKKIEFKQAKNDFVGFGDPILVAENKPKEISYTKLFSRGVANAEEIRNMDELPETADELKSIAQIFKGNSKLYLREDFNEEVVKTINLNDYKIISFATHAVIANEINNIAEPGLILTPPDKPTEINDGILTVSEVEKLDLQSDIVILSACNTAAEDGSPNAEGLSGLASAFFQAGTKSILVTHWDVETNSAVKLTTGMFDKMQKTKNLSQALHLSKMDILGNEETSHPLFWAPFVLIGNVTQSIN